MNQGNMTTFGKGLSSFSTLFNALNTYQTGSVASDKTKINAKMYQMKGNKSLLKASNNENSFRIEGQKILGVKRADTASSGFDVSSGTALDAYNEKDREINRKAMDIRLEGKSNKLWADYEAECSRIEARLSRKKSRNNAIGTTIGAFNYLPFGG